MRGLISIVVLASVVLLGTLPAEAYQTGGHVSMTRFACDYFLVSTKRGFVLFEWWSGADPDEGDIVFGTDTSFYTYGFHNIWNQTQQEGMHIYVEDYDLDEDEAIDQLNEHCE